MKSASPLATRPGFTLFELTIAMALGVMVSGAALYAYMGANRAQAVTVGGNLLKVSGQQTIGDIYRKLNGARRLYDRQTSATTDTAKFLKALPIAGYNGGAAGGLTPGVVLAPISDVVLPQIKASGSFAIQIDNGTSIVNNANFDQASVGNALFFLGKDPKAVIDETKTPPTASTIQTAAFGTPQFYIHAYRFHFYFLARRQLPLNAPRVRSDVNWVYQLMHWDSLPYLDKGELESWMAAIYKSNNSTATQTFVNTKLANLAAQYAGAVDSGQDDPDTAMFQLVRNSSADYTHLKPAVVGSLLVTGHFAHAVKSELRTTFGEGFVAFNTVGQAPTPVVPVVPIQALNNADNSNLVPNYADKNTGIPYGFETMIVGPPASRKVLVHLTLAARTQPGNVMMGDGFQQVSQLYDY